MSADFGLVVQQLGTRDAVLAMSLLGSFRSETGWFKTRDVADLYEKLRIPEPANISRTLGRLRDNDGYLRDRGSGSSFEWTVTPLGERRIEETLGTFDYDRIAVELAELTGAEFAHIRHSTVPPSLAPSPWTAPIMSFLERYPFESNAFLMTRFPEEDAEDSLDNVIQILRSELREHGLHLHLASDQQIIDELWANVGAHMWACRFGVGVLETSRSSTFNDNVLIELGSMLTLGRRCLVLKEQDTPMPPTDLTSHIFKSVRLDREEQVITATRDWVQRDLRL